MLKTKNWARNIVDYLKIANPQNILWLISANANIRIDHVAIEYKLKINLLLNVINNSNKNSNNCNVKKIPAKNKRLKTQTL